MCVELGQIVKKPRGSFAEQVVTGLLGPAEVVRQAERMVRSRDVTGSIIDLGEIRDSVILSVTKLPDKPVVQTDRLKPLLEQLVQIVEKAIILGLDQRTAAEALQEVKSIADAMQKPEGNGAASLMRKGVRTLRGIAEELTAIPEVAARFKGLIDQMSGLVV